MNVIVRHSPPRSGPSLGRGFQWFARCLPVLTLLLSLCAPVPAESLPQHPLRPTTAEASSNPEVRVQDGLVTLDVRDAEVGPLLQEICRQGGVALALGPEIHGTITLRMTAVPLEQALARLCKNRALVFRALPEAKGFRVTGVGAYASRREPEHDEGAKNEPRNPMQQNREDSGPKETDHRGRPLYKSGEILIRCAEGIPEKELEAFHEALGAHVIARIGRLERLSLPHNMPEKQAVALYTASGLVSYAERHALRYPQTNPNDPRLLEQWGLTRSRVLEVWETTRGTPEVIVAVIDGGAALDHPDLAGSIYANPAEQGGTAGIDDDRNGYVDDIHGWDFAGDSESDPEDQDNDPSDRTGHGTHVAGTIAATGDNGMGVAGVCWGGRVLVLKAQADDSAYMENWAILEALDYAVRAGARVVNCSFGGEAYSLAELEAYEGLGQAGVLAVCAAGNDGADLDEGSLRNYPASYDLDNILSVAAGNEDDRLAGFSNHGKASVDVMAPGVSILSTTLATTYTEASVTAGPTSYPAEGLEFAGRTDTQGITAGVVDCGLGGDPTAFPEEVAGRIALIERGGEILFATKVSNAQAAGAVGAVIYDNVSGDPSHWTLGAPDDWIPAVGLSKSDGEEIKARLPLTLTLINRPSDDPAHYDVREGTSMATALVSGVAGLLLSADSTLTPEKIKSAILRGADRIPDLLDHLVSGGRVNARCSLCSLRIEDLALEQVIALLRILAGLPAPAGTCRVQCLPDLDGNGLYGLPDALSLLRSLSNG